MEPIRATHTASTQAPTARSDVAKTAGSSEASDTKPTAFAQSQLNRQQQNTKILENSLQLSLKSDNQSLSLLFKTSLEAIQRQFTDKDEKSTAAASAEKVNTETKPQYQQQDTSPEATAKRIVGFATGFYQQYQQQNAADPKVLDNFIGKISEGIDKGFADARDILKSLQKLEGKVATDIDETYRLIQQGLDDFRKRNEPAKAESAA